MSIEIASEDVIKLMLQFLNENNLAQSFETLQKESGVYLNNVDNIDTLISNIRNGVWDEVLITISTLHLPETLIMDLYEHICLEFIEMKEIDVARVLVHNSPPLIALKAKNPEKYKRLQYFVDNPSTDSFLSFSNTTKEKRRNQLCKEITKEVNDAAPSKLLNLISHALRFQQLQGKLEPGIQYDLFKGKEIQQVSEDLPPRFCSSTIKLNPKSRVECSIFSPDGQYLITGSVEGFIEVRDSMTGKLSNIEYQKQNKFMFHDKSVLCLGFTKDGEFLVSGSQSGEIKVWELKSGRCLRKIERAHREGVTSVSFNKDGSRILSTSFDMLAKIHGIKSGKSLKTFQEHIGYVNNGFFTKDGSMIVTCSSDGYVKVWNVKTTKCVSSFQSAGKSIEVPIHNIQPIPNQTDQFLVCNQTNAMCIMDIYGQLIRTIQNEDPSPFLNSLVSPKGSLAYGISESGQLSSYSIQTGKLVSSLQLPVEEVVSICKHPHKNLVVTSFMNGEIKFWKS